ncbi:MAG TPA: NAD(P)H-binding protein [Burkholderiales bacterium]|nr:NAD(P)H-binding protein [Burkholderiales bacterium]
MSPETILVTGAAGSTGSTARVAVVILLEQGHRVRAMVRTLEPRADRLRDLGAEVVVADMLDIVGVRAAMRACQARSAGCCRPRRPAARRSWQLRATEMLTLEGRCPR